MIEAYLLHLLSIIGLYAILAVSLNLVVGYGGMLNLGHAALFGIGAYTSALLSIEGVPFPLSIAAAGVAASLSGLLLVTATKRLKDEYLALTTLGFGFVVYSLMLNLKSLTQGPLGLASIPKPSLFGLEFSTKTQFVLLIGVAAAASIFVMWRIASSPFGRLLRAVREDETYLKVLGKDTFKVKCKAMMTSGFFAGVSGSLYAHYMGYIDPGSFTLNSTILLFMIVIVGGLASIRGTILSTFAVILIPEALRFLDLPSSVIGPMRNIMYACILLLILYYRPRGIYGDVSL